MISSAFSLLLLTALDVSWAALNSSEHRDLLYPHMAGNGDIEFLPEEGYDSLDDVFRILKRVDTKCRYKLYGEGRTKLFIGSNGYVTFDNGATAFMPKNMCDAPAPMVAAIWEDNFTQAPNALGSHIWYREERTNALRNRARDDIRAAFNQGDCNADDFKPTCLLIVTWQRQESGCDYLGQGHVTRRRRETVGGRAERETDANPSNYYQLVWATDDQDSYAIFNVLALNWWNCWKYSRSGFHDGDSQCAELPDSGTSNVSNLKVNSNVGFEGRWIYRTDQSAIRNPDCSSLGPSDVPT